MRHARRAAALAAIAIFVGIVGGVRAQGGDTDDPGAELGSDPIEGFDLGAIRAILPPGLEGSPRELQAYQEARAGRHIKARELAEEILRRRPDSYAAHFVLGYVHYHGEANFPRALYHLERARALFSVRWGDPPSQGAPWRWHSQTLMYLVWTHGDLEHHEEQLAWMQRYNELYEPDMIAEMAWPLMKLRRFDRARAIARAALASGDSRQIEIALNALCAVEFEAGDDEASYRACRTAMELHGGDPSLQSAVDFTNFAEAARGALRLDEAERVGLLATEAQVSWYGNPHVELAELYVREARFIEALASLREVPRYRERRPPHVRDADRNDARRALAEFFLVVGRSADATRITQRMVIAPDRRGHNSRDPQQDVAIAALLHRRARSMDADRVLIDALGAPLHERIWAQLRAAAIRLEAWTAGRQAARALADETRLVGTFMIGTHRSAVLPPWLAGEMAAVLGPGVTIEAVRRARAEDRREAAAGYYDAFEAEAALLGGDPARGRELALRAIGRLAPAEALLAARMHAIAAESARREGDLPRALESYDQAFQIDPGIFARMELTVPVRVTARGGELASAIAETIASSPRFDVEDVGLRVEVEGDADRVRACLSGASGSVLSCADVERRSAEAAEAYLARAVREFHEAAFAPRIDLTQTDASSLDGSNTVSRRPLEGLFSIPEGDLDPE